MSDEKDKALMNRAREAIFSRVVVLAEDADIDDLDSLAFTLLRLDYELPPAEDEEEEDEDDE